MLYRKKNGAVKSLINDYRFKKSHVDILYIAQYGYTTIISTLIKVGIDVNVNRRTS